MFRIILFTFFKTQQKKSKYGWSRFTNYHNTKFGHVVDVDVTII